MNRDHTRDFYFQVIDKFRKHRPDIAFSSDFIVGYPGESDKDFEDTLDLVKQVGYAQCYSFKYSPRPGTPASMVEDQVPEEVKSARLTTEKIATAINSSTKLKARRQICLFLFE